MSHSWPRVEQLFHEALKRTGQERADFLNRACEGHPSLRIEVEALLESDEQATGFLSTPVTLASPVIGGLADGSHSSSDRERTKRQRQFEFSAGTGIGNYRVVRPLGRGGMGEVYEAEDLTLGRHVAIKLLSAVSDSADARARLLREARTASSLNHRHIVTVHSIERDRDGHDFIVMEYVEGTTLRERLVLGALELDELLTVAVQTADALAAAHARGVVHRDLKPENVMLGSAGDVKLLDFGIAAHARTESGFDLEPPAQGAIVGTVSYMSPEQAAGEQTDFRSDQFSLGSILYEAASTIHPFRSANHAQTLARVLCAAARPLNELCPSMPDPLRWIIERCLAREPERRYAATADLYRELAMLRTRLFEVMPTDQVAPVPIPRTAIIGRAKELATAARLVLENGARLVTLTGPGGVGKTRLALELATTLGGRFGGRVFFVDLSPIRDAGDAAKAIANALGVRAAAEPDARSALVRWSRERQHSPLFLVIDNFEHVLGAASLVGDLLAASKSITVLATSRAALRLAGEHDVNVPPLALPDARHAKLEQLSGAAAVALFVQRATAARSDFLLAEDNALAIARICERLDGLPLAIELAAARIRLLSPATILSRLEHRLDILTGGPRDAPQRQQSFRAALAWSEELLEPSEQMVFRRMSVFSGGCTSEAIEAVCNVRQDLTGNIEDLLGGLIEKNMVVRTNDADPLRVTQLETIREYAQERLAACQERTLAQHAHAAYYLILAEEGYGLRGLEQSHWMRRSEVEYANFRSAYEWLLGNHKFEWGVRLTSALMPFWEGGELLAEGLDWINRLLLLPHAVQPPEWRARALSNSCYLIHLQGDIAAWMPRNAEMLDAFSQLDDLRSLALAKVSYGVVFAQIGQHDEARAQVEEGLALWRQAGGDARGEAGALSNLATLAKISGDTTRSRELFQRARELFEKNGLMEGVAWSLNHEADAARWAGDLESAHALLQSALGRFRAVGDDGGVANCLADLATIWVDKDPHVSERYALDALRLLSTTGHSREIARVLETLARNASYRDDPQGTLRLAGAAAAIRHKFGRYDRLELRHPGDAVELQRVVTKSRERAENRATTFWTEGWSAPLATTVEYALATIRPATNPTADTGDPSFAEPPKRDPLVPPIAARARE